MKHHPSAAEGAAGTTGRTLSEVLDACSRLTRPKLKYRCHAPYCWGAADYLIPQGKTTRTADRALQLCVDCFSAYVERLRTSIVLPGEPCEWRATLESAENIFDGSHDWRRDLLRNKCAHRSCEAARKAEESDLASPSEARA